MDILVKTLIQKENMIWTAFANISQICHRCESSRNMGSRADLYIGQVAHEIKSGDKKLVQARLTNNK